jgi:uncharacterized protein YjaG (DUF416 family)
VAENHLRSSCNFLHPVCVRLVLNNLIFKNVDHETARDYFVQLKAWGELEDFQVLLQLQFHSISSQNSVITIKDLNVSFNKKLVDFNYTIWNNDGIQTYSFNSSIQTFVVLTKLWVYATFRFPETKNDKKFSKEGIKVVIDVEKALSGIQNNFVLSKIVESIVKSFDHNMKFPLKKVSLSRSD